MSQSIVAIRRYPVKCMGGEDLARVQLDTRGLVGDRWYAVVDGEGHFASGKRTRRFRRHDEVFAYRASTTGLGVEVATGSRSWMVGDAGLDDHLSNALGEPVRVMPEAAVPHFDAGAVSLVTTGTLRWCESELGVDADPRRLRSNLVVEADEPFIEESWVGRILRVGSATLRVVVRIERCRTIDVEQDGAAAARRWLKPLAAAREMRVGVYTDVVEMGVVSIGDVVAAVRSTQALETSDTIA